MLMIPCVSLENDICNPFDRLRNAAPNAIQLTLSLVGLSHSASLHIVLIKGSS